VGGGLGGAAVALALARKGFRVRLIEQAPEFGVIGYGIQLGPNAFHMFDRLGVSEAVLMHAIIPNSLLMLDSVDGGIIARIPTGASFMTRFKHPYIVIHRVDLHHILLDACKANNDIELIPLTNVIATRISVTECGFAPKAIGTLRARRLLVSMACAQPYGSKWCGSVSLA
jgi:3-hydroxybenzoate 6-monooxygenase